MSAFSRFITVFSFFFFVLFYILHFTPQCFLILQVCISYMDHHHLHQNQKKNKIESCLYANGIIITLLAVKIICRWITMWTEMPTHTTAGVKEVCKLYRCFVYNNISVKDKPTEESKSFSCIWVSTKLNYTLQVLLYYFYFNIAA